MRAAGVGEVAVSFKINQLMESDSPTIQAKEPELAGKYLCMAKKTMDINQGIIIVIKGTGQE